MFRVANLLARVDINKDGQEVETCRLRLASAPYLSSQILHNGRQIIVLGKAPSEVAGDV